MMRGQRRQKLGTLRRFAAARLKEKGDVQDPARTFAPIASIESNVNGVRSRNDSKVS
jgi:hypothetical protein